MGWKTKDSAKNLKFLKPKSVLCEDTKILDYATS